MARQAIGTLSHRYALESRRQTLASLLELELESGYSEVELDTSAIISHQFGKS